MLVKGLFGAAMLLGLGGGFAHSSDYPPIVKEKTLYANVDFRGKQAPKLEVGKWLRGANPATKGKVVLIDFWATWCPPCRAVIPELGKWQKAYGDKLVVIGISDETAETVTDFMKTHPMPYHVAIDPNSTMDKKLGVQGIPHIIVISPDGIVRWQGFPLDDKDSLTDAKLAQILKAAKV